ncbi:MAG: PD-(D/E)XK nuclease family protein [Opitutales bacterium]
MTPEYRTLDWNAPLIPAIVRELLSDQEDPATDLGDTVVLVPTVQSGRRLREALALALATKDGGLFPPQILTPDACLNEALAGHSAAGEATLLAAWSVVLGKTDLTQYDFIFPIKPARSTGWQLSMARRLMHLRSELGEAGLDFAEAANRTAGTPHEPERWRQLAELEALYLEELTAGGRHDPLHARRNAARQGRLPDGTQRVILAATPDPQPLVLEALENADAAVSLEIWTYGPPNEPNCFDNRGRPDASVWEERHLSLEALGAHLHNTEDPAATGELSARLLCEKTPESITLGIADPELTPILSDALTRARIHHFDPGGEPLHLSGPGRLAALLCTCGDSADITTVRTLLQHPDFVRALRAETPQLPSQEKLLRAIDEIFEDHLPPDLPALLYFAAKDPKQAGVHKALKQLQDMLAPLGGKDFPTALAQTLQRIYTHLSVQSEDQADNPHRERAALIRRQLENALENSGLHAKLPSDYPRNALRQALENTRFHPPRPTEAHDLLGWLELLWNDAPHLVLAGLNEGRVPESVIGDAFLPETAREHLGLRTNPQRFARDAYLLAALAQRRRSPHGRIDILVPRKAPDGSPLKPSRLLFQEGNDSLVTRARTLFTAPATAISEAPRTRPWQLIAPQGLLLPERLSVSSLRTYLECPFRFFLRHILKMRPVDTKTRELSPAGFGNLIHDTLKILKGRRLDAQTDVKALDKELRNTAGEIFRRNFGHRPSFALRMQETALLARLESFCHSQIADCETNGGMDILNTEHDIELELEGFTLTGRIDRIDRRADGRIELVDYKSGDTPVTPAKAHLSGLARKEPPEHLPPEAKIRVNDKPYCWTDLQLPLYALAQNERGGEQLPATAYFNLPKSLEKSGLARWQDFDREQLESARNCACAVLRQIKAGVFWPPNPGIASRYDEFAPLFPDGIEATIDPEAFRNYAFGEASENERPPG